MIDEWVAHTRQLHDTNDLPDGDFETQFTFAQTLSEEITDRVELAALAGGSFAGLEELGTESKRPVVLAGGESIIRWIVLPAVTHLANPAFQWSSRSYRVMASSRGN